MSRKRRFTNHQVFQEAIENVQRLGFWSQECQNKVIQNQNIKFDTRNLMDLAPLLFELNGDTEAEQKADFKRQYDEMIDAFNTPGATPGKPDPEAIKPYIQRMFNSLVTNLDDVDYDNLSQVQNSISSMRATQCIATIIDDFPLESMDLFPTHDAMQRIDALAARSYMVFVEGRVAMSYEGLDHVSDYVQFNPGSSKSTQMELQAQLSNQMYDATLAGKSEIVFDPTVSEEMTKFFMDKSFTVLDEFGYGEGKFNIDYTQNNYANDFVTSISVYYAQSSYEQMLVKHANGEDTGLGRKFTPQELLVIGGKSVGELIDNIQKEKEIDTDGAREEVGKMLRDALTTGTPPVTLITSSFTKDGKVKFHNKDLKVDLDKLNAEERVRNHNVFRRMLDRIGIWKIPKKYPTNEARDAKLAADKASPDSEHNKAVKDAQDLLLKAYNGIKRPVGTHKGIVNIIPEVTREKENQVDLSVSEIKEADKSREPFPVNELTTEKNIDIEPPKHETEKVMTHEALRK